MGLDPKLFDEDPYGPYPEKGQRIRCTLNSGIKCTGIVKVVWMAMEVVTIDVILEDVQPGDTIRSSPAPRSIISIAPEFGDKWEPA